MGLEMIKNLAESRTTLAVLSFISSIILLFIGIFLNRLADHMEMVTLKAFGNATSIGLLEERTRTNKIDIKGLCLEVDDHESRIIKIEATHE